MIESPLWNHIARLKNGKNDNQKTFGALNEFRKKFALVLLTLLVASLNTPPAIAAGEYVGDLDLRTQADVDAFDYTSVTGTLYFWDLDNEDPSDDIVDLSPVSSVLESVGEGLWFDTTKSLTTVEGFENVTSLGGLYFYSNESLVSVSGFNNLLTTGDNFEFYLNSSLTTITGFRQLQSVRSLEIIENAVLTTLPMLESLVAITGQIFIYDNASLPRITGFNSLDLISNAFVVSVNPELGDLCGFYNFAAAHNPFDGSGDVIISDNHPTFPSPASMQDIVDAGPCECYALTTSHTGLGSDPAAFPANSNACPAGEYLASELIDLTATPDSGWGVQGWSGTVEDSSTSNTNQLIMPASDTVVSVTYGPACYLLTSSISGSGANLFRFPSKSIGCDADHYLEGEIIGLLANPADGWILESWSGTDNDSSTGNSNQATMPASAWAVSVTYRELARPELIFSDSFEP